MNGGFLRYDFGGLIFGGTYTWRGLFSEFYGILDIYSQIKLVDSVGDITTLANSRSISTLSAFTQNFLKK